MRKADNLPPSCAVVTKSGALNSLEPSGPVQACNGSALPLPLLDILQRNSKRTTDTFLFISHTTNVLLFKFRCNIFIGVRIIKEMPGSVANGTHCIIHEGELNERPKIAITIRDAARLFVS